MGEQQSTDLVITALDTAAATRGTFPAGVVLHADQGTQFTSQKLAAYMRAVNGTVSMRQAAVCWDNAMSESLWDTLTTEYYYRRAFTTRDQVDTGIVTWIEDFYNRRRIHTSLGGRSPIEDERHQAACTTAAETNRQQLAHRPNASILSNKKTDTQAIEHALFVVYVTIPATQLDRTCTSGRIILSGASMAHSVE